MDGFAPAGFSSKSADMNSFNGLWGNFFDSFFGDGLSGLFFDDFLSGLFGNFFDRFFLFTMLTREKYPR